MFYYVGLFTGYDYHKCNYANIADDFGEGEHRQEGGAAAAAAGRASAPRCFTGARPAGCHFMTLRRTAASFGAVTAPLFYWITRNWGGSIYAGVRAAGGCDHARRGEGPRSCWLASASYRLPVA